MELKSSFQAEWRAKFAKQPPPSLSCFSKGSKNSSRMENLRQAYEQCKCNIASLHRQLSQEQFIESFLKNAITEMIESREISDRSQPKDGSSPETEKKRKNENGEESEMIEIGDNYGTGFIEVVNNDGGSYARVTSFKSFSTRSKKEKRSFLKRRKWDKRKVNHEYETVSFPLGTMDRNNTSETLPASEFPQSNTTQNVKNDIVKDTPGLKDTGNSSEDNENYRAVNSGDKLPVHRMSSETGSVSSTCSASSCKINIGNYKDDVDESPSIDHVTTGPDVDVKKCSPKIAPKPPPRKLKYSRSSLLDSSSDQNEESCDTIYDNVTRIYVKPHADTTVTTSEGGRVRLDTDIDVISGHGSLQKVNDKLQDLNGNDCMGDNPVVNNASHDSNNEYNDGSTLKGVVHPRAGNEGVKEITAMRKFRSKNDQESVVGTSFRKIDRTEVEDRNFETRLSRQLSTESYGSAENDMKDNTSRKITPEIAAALLKENSRKHPKAKPRPDRRSLPHYENWSFHSALTHPGLSIVDQDLNDTGSDDDCISVTSARSRDSALSDDVIHGDGRRTISESEYIKRKAIKGIQITDEDVYYIQENNRSTLQSEDSLDGAPPLSKQGDDYLSQQSVDSVLQNNDDSDIFSGRESDIQDLDRKDERKSEDETSSNDSSDELDGSKEEINEDEQERAEKLRMRHLVVNAILESEYTYMSVLDDLRKFKRLLQNIAMSSQTLISLEDVTTIFYKVEDIYKHHKGFVSDLEARVKDWSDEQKIGKTFKVLVVYFPMYIEYMNNYQTAVETIHRCCQESADFEDVAKETPVGSEKTTLEEILFKPVQRIQKNTLVLHDLLQYTPKDHPDHEELTKALTLCEFNLKDFGSQLNHCLKAEESHHLMKSSFIVEIVNHTRKLRYLFLFNDVIICTKHKPSGKNRGTFECKWFIPLSQVKCDCVTDKQEEKSYTCKENIDELKRKIVGLKSDLRSEMRSKEGTPKDRTWSLAGKKTARGIEKLKKRIAEQEGALVLASPHLPFRLYSDEERPYTFLLSTDFEREEWREAVQSQLNRYHGHSKASMNIHDVQEILQNCKQLPEVNSIGTVLMKKDEEMLSGSLNVTIHQLIGLDEPCDTYCCLELDSYGHFFMKARTSVCRNDLNPSWDMDFELELDGSQTLRILCYRVGSESGGDVLLGRSALELSRAWLKNSFCEKTISMNEISLIVSIRHTSASKTMKRTPSKHSSGIFGVKLQNVTRREGKTVPCMVTTCVQEIEKRGLEEVGLYRVSGVTSDIQRLKKLFDKNPRAAANLLGEMDINAVTGVLKLYFRELPEPLFTDAQYRSFIDTIGLGDLEAKEKCMLQLLHSLPDANYYTIVYMIEHLVRVSKHCVENKMTLNNLSTIFGPTLLHPAVRDSMMSMADFLNKGAQEVFSQSGVVSYLLNLVASGRNIRRCIAS